MANKLTNTRTKFQFTQYGKVINGIFNGNKLMAMFSIKSQYGNNSFTILQEYKANDFLPEGLHTIN